MSLWAVHAHRVAGPVHTALASKSAQCLKATMIFGASRVLQLRPLLLGRAQTAATSSSLQPHLPDAPGLPGASAKSFFTSRVQPWRQVSAGSSERPSKKAACASSKRSK